MLNNSKKLTTENSNKKVFVGMSGGVDSSVSALLLKEQGYDVTGVFIKVWQPDFIECTWKEDRLDAMRVATQLDIPFITLDLEKEYKEEVIDYMIEEYRNGRTPNPDIMCNRFVKFGAFWKWAKEQGADYISTGHYAQVDLIPFSVIPLKKGIQVSKNTDLDLPSFEFTNSPLFQGNDNTKHFLKKGLDQNKDQSYFLWMLNEEDLKHILFPVGHLVKDEVRKIGEKNNIYTSRKKDSQGLCFVGSIDIKTLLKEYIKEERGDVKNEEGEVIGYHEGSTFYTIGERHHFIIIKKSTNDSPYFIVKKNIEKNELIVSHNKPEEKDGDEFLIEKVSFVNQNIDESKIYEARGRYRAPLAKVQIKKSGDKYIVKKIEGELTAVSGQSLVIYDGDICSGGGIIV